MESETAERSARLKLQKGYLDRALDAYARAYRNTKETETKTSKTYLYNRLKTLYSVRFDGKTDGLDNYLRSITGTPFPNPLSPVIREQ